VCLRYTRGRWCMRDARWLKVPRSSSRSLRCLRCCTLVAADRASQTAQWRRAAVLAGSAIGLAIAAKQNAVAVAALGVLAGGLVPFSGEGPWRARLFDGAWVACAVTIATAYQNVYWLPPAFSEYPDYDAAIAPQIAKYKSERLLGSASNRPVRFGFLAFTVLGLFSALRDVLRDRLSPRTRGAQLLIAWLGTQIGFVVLALPVGWQRYYLPLLPPLCLFAGIGVVQSVSAFSRRIRLQRNVKTGFV
jgi:hypothetical protein